MKPIVACCNIIVNLLFTGFAIQAKADTTDNFQVYLNKEIVLRENDYRPEVSSLKYLTLGPSNANDTIFVNYNHCTAGASGRKIVIWYGDDILFSRSYADKDAASLMAIPVKDIASIYNRPANNSAIVMRYYDDQLPPDGMILAMLRGDNPIPSQSPKQELVKQQQKKQPVLEWAVAGIMILIMGILIFKKMARKPTSLR